MLALINVVEIVSKSEYIIFNLFIVAQDPICFMPWSPRKLALIKVFLIVEKSEYVFKDFYLVSKEEICMML